MTDIKEIDPSAACELLAADPRATLIDVRSTMEYQYVGHPPQALSIPWKEPPGWEVRPEFVAQVRAALEQRHRGPVEDVPVLAICRSGQRSHAAGCALLDAGFRDVYNVLEGFEGDRDGNGHRNTLNGWRVRGLPWVQS